MGGWMNLGDLREKNIICIKETIGIDWIKDINNQHKTIRELYCVCHLRKFRVFYKRNSLKWNKKKQDLLIFFCKFED